MAITQRILNFDVYYRTTTGDKIIVNDLSYMDVTLGDMVMKSLMTIYDNTETISSKPSCDCGKSQGMYLLNRVCTMCGTPVKDIDQKVDPVLWLKAFTPELKFLNTTYWLMLSQVIDSKYDWLRYLADSRFNPNLTIPAHIVAIREKLGNKRSYSHVMNNIETILNYMLTLPKYKVGKKLVMIQSLLELYNTHKEDLFSTYLPIVNKKLFVIENTNKGRFVNLIVADIVDVALSWIKTSSLENPSMIRLENTTASAISNLAGLYKNYFINYVGKKKGILRKHVYGARSHFTFRTVITSIPGKHDHDEIIPPWSIMVTVFRPFILNKLEKRGYKYKDADKLLFKAVITYIPVIDEILEELIRESYGGKLSCIMQRNPSLLQGSALLTYIKRYEKDPNNKTCAISAKVAKCMNADQKVSL